MKATELTIGSLIKTNKGDIVKVESISTKRQHRKVGYHKNDDCYHITYVRLEQCEPIVLTEEILKANEFVYKESFEEWWHYEEFPLSDVQLNDSYDEETDEWCVSIRINNCDYNIHYVHELQLALRLCGLNGLADNFKIE